MSVIEKDWTYKVDIDDIEIKLFDNYKTELNSVCGAILKLFDDNFLLQNINYQANLAQNFEEDLKTLTEGNKSLKDEIDFKLKELADRQIKYENYKQDHKLLSQEIKETHEAFLMAKKCYKKILKIYYCIEKKCVDTHVIFLQFFTENKKENENYSVRLLRHINNGQYEFHSIQPKLKNFKDLQKRLLQTNDVPGALCCARKAFLDLRKNK